MKKKIITAITAFAVFCSSIIAGTGMNAQEAKASETGTVYYVSTLHGRNSNDGKSEKTPFYSLQKINELELKPGDKVLLECGSVFTDGYLHLYEQSGSKTAPIVIDKYGEGSPPVIDTNGQGIWFQNYGNRLDAASHKKYGYVSSSILLYDTEYIEINNLEIVNDAVDIEAVYNEAHVMNRTGVAAVAQNKGTIDHIYLNGLNIHDVYGNVYDKHMNNGGIYFTVFLPQDAVEENGEFVSETGISRFDDVLIENCSVRKTNRWGIAVGYTAYWNKFPDSKSDISDEDIKTYGSTNVVIRNNYVKEAGGDAITTMYCDRPLIEYNVADGVAAQINTTDYVNVDGRGGRVAAGIWPWKCKDAIFQYNEAFDTQNGDTGNDDAQAWDADSGDGTVYQYNYSHNNTGGCVMFCLGRAYQNTFRYNISQNDLKGAMDIAGNPDAHVYNNTFYMKEGVPFIRQRTNGGNMVAENNIIYYAGDTPMQDTWTKKGKVGITYSNNLYYNYTDTPASDANPVVVTRGKTVMQDPGNAPASTIGFINYHENPNERSMFDGYKLTKNSPAIGAGKIITDNNGKALCETDFFGNKISSEETPDIGAHKYQENEKELIPQKPQKTETGKITPNSVTISWPAVSDPVGIKGYKIVSGSQVLMKIENLDDVMDPDTNIVTVQLKNLEPGKTYHLSVVAYDVNNMESKPANFTFTTAAAPPKEDEETNEDVNNVQKIPSVTLDKTSLTLYTKKVTSAVLKAEPVHISGVINWSSSNPKVATVLDGKVTAKKAGTAVITAEIGGYKATCNVTVKKPSLKVKKSVTLKKGKKYTLKTTAEPKNKITYKIKGKKVIKVSKKGVIKGLKKGNCKLVVSCNGIKKTIKVKVK